MKPGRLFTGARTPRLALLALLSPLLGLSTGCLTPKPDLKTPSPNLRLPKPSNVSNVPREMPPKPADTPPPVSIRIPPKEVPPTMTGPSVLSSGQSVNGNLTTTITPPVQIPRSVATMPLTSANSTYTANPPVGPLPVERNAGTNSGIVAPAMPPPPADPAAVLPPTPKLGAPSLPGTN